MAVRTLELNVPTAGKSEMLDITGDIENALKESGINEGIINIFVPGSTASVSTVEFEPGLEEDVPRALDKIAPFGPNYAHHATWHDDNGASHVRATIMGPGITVPFAEKKPILGDWQQIVVIDHDTRPRERKLVLTIIGD